MILRKGNMWYSGADLICVTGNSTIRSDGAVVMGRGAALECMQKFVGINFYFGKQIRQYIKQAGDDTYGVVVYERDLTPDVGLFQVKHHFRDDADLALITNSVARLIPLAGIYRNVSVNMPGTGYGRLNREDVLPLLEPLPDNVTVWEYAE